MSENIYMSDLQERKAFTKGFKKGLATERKDVDNVSKLVQYEQDEYSRLYKESKKCARCGGKTGLTLDHIVPKAYLKDFCINTDIEYVEGNYQLLCRLCNAHKASKLDFSIGKTKEIMLRLLNNI